MRRQLIIPLPRQMKQSIKQDFDDLICFLSISSRMYFSYILSTFISLIHVLQQVLTSIRKGKIWENNLCNESFSCLFLGTSENDQNVQVYV